VVVDKFNGSTSVCDPLNVRRRRLFCGLPDLSLRDQCVGRVQRRPPAQPYYGGDGKVKNRRNAEIPQGIVAELMSKMTRQQRYSGFMDLKSLSEKS